jgi:hypothetical protein
MELTEEIDNALVNVLDYICKNPLIFVSETDIYSLVMGELMEIHELHPKRLYPTNCTIGLNKFDKPSKEKYKTRRVHKEYGHADIHRARSDIVILNHKDILEIDDPLNLKVDGKWIKPDYIFEFGTEKAARGKRDFKEHLNNDIKKAEKSKEKGYVIHIQRNFWKKRKSGNRTKYEEYSEVIKKSLKNANKRVRTLVIIVDIGNEGRRISKEGKIKIFKDDRFKGVNQNKVKEEIKSILK